MKNYNLIRARKNKGYTQVELSNILKCNKSTISNWENGVSSPTLRMAFALSAILESDINVLFQDYKVQEFQSMNTA
ncbi:XRE family transcriptional regulator [Cytobacillus horneckiae]|uniref:XRE family transcriptional regulator n=1 Tax=Cytobacillus horneckiae TaxID=549687 RepID=A0A2N0Z9U9_9BACI|nr:helix-turn-helix transcriptional regulator [Cytobacillus horneckiae]MBN6886154.1 helix-turn-helix transcriptional regulator [Cytobacillus horneckiae]MCM3176454.1 helix-turn-helix domain-containing protein [Cytobacillus horneckiae]MEC1158383.1 helix-turn-helix transcriptional regulator [Cytobacillus horneckiae]MED2937344.1 helix-turn-helix transcriptional regulator [Cytobacillus horneckiae]PKG26294.1 XRE family transcriptional regulator [Cytobacillus horneckiae]